MGLLPLIQSLWGASKPSLCYIFRQSFKWFMILTRNSNYDQPLYLLISNFKPLLLYYVLQNRIYSILHRGAFYTPRKVSTIYHSVMILVSFFTKTCYLTSLAPSFEFENIFRILERAENFTFIFYIYLLMVISQFRYLAVNFFSVKCNPIYLIIIILCFLLQYYLLILTKTCTSGNII